MSRKLKLPDPTLGRAYVGVWRDGSLGWCAPKYIHSKSDSGKPETTKYNRGRRVYLCEVSITPILDKNGRPIVRILR